MKPEPLKVMSKIKAKQLKPVPARLSTLVEPFDSMEYREKVSLKILKHALKKKYPLIINTKSTLLTEEPWIRIIEDLASEGLIVVQYSISLFDDEKARNIEPNAPSVSERLKIASKLSEINVPIVLRISPFIPDAYDIDEIVDTTVSAGSKHVIAESLRGTLDMFVKIHKLLNIKPP